MKPPKRKRTSVQASAPETRRDEKYTTEEKCALLEGLKKYGKDDLQSIRTEFLPERTQQSIAEYVNVLTYKAKGLVLPEDKVPKAPIEQWLQLSEDLTEYKDDYSFLLTKLMSLIDNFETEVSASEPSQPNYSAIYRYLGALLADDDLPILSSLDSAVVMDLLEHVANQLRTLDTTDQRKLMIQKHNLLKTPIDINKAKSLHRTINQELFRHDSHPEPSTSQGESSIAGISQPQGVAAVCSSVLDGTELSAATHAANSSLSTTESSKSNTSTVTKIERQKNKDDDTDSSPKKRKRTSSFSAPNVTTEAGNDDTGNRHLLYTLNPFAVPIQYLKFKPRISRPQHTKETPVRTSSTNTQTVVHTKR